MNKIFTFWQQGFNNAPPLVKVCNESLKRNTNEEIHELICLEGKNLFSYVDLPGYVMDKYSSGKISHTHFSDVVRSVLLKQYGGLWVDASVLVTRPLVEQDIFGREFFTLKPGDCAYQWVVYLMGGDKDFPLFSLLVDFWFAYWKKESQIITYALTDNIFNLAYKENSRIRKAIDSCPCFAMNPNYWGGMLNQPYSEKIYNETFLKEPYWKLTYKRPLHKNTSAEIKTFYGKLLEEYLDEN